jgi:hypothetical protein
LSDLAAQIEAAIPRLWVATLLWDANNGSKSFSSMYDEAWVEKLYRGITRNLTRPFHFVCYSDRPRDFAEPIEVKLMRSQKPTYADCIQPFEMAVPMLLMGLDTVITGNIDDLADYCLTADVMALPRDPYKPEQSCNGVCLVPAGYEHVWTDRTGENDMVWMRKQRHVFIDDLFPGQVQSYKGAVKAGGLGDTRICYFHGREKPHELPAGHPILEHW